MFKLLKHAKNCVAPIIAVVILLFIQGICDLTLPQYTSNIVNVGIQQGGIANPTPEAISADSLENLKLFMSEEDIAAVDNAFKAIDKNDYSQKEYDRLLKKYSKLEETEILLRRKTTDDELAALDAIFAKPELLVYTIRNGGEDVEQMKTAVMQQMQTAAAEGAIPEGAIPEGIMTEGDIDIITMIKSLPDETRMEMIKQIDEQFSQMPESIIEQTAVVFVKSEYSSIGVDVDSLQTHSILMIGINMLLISLLSVGASIMVGLIASRFAAGLGRDLRGKVFSNVMDFSSSEFDKFSTASLITRSTNDIQQIQFAMVMILRMVIYAPIMGIGGIIKVFQTNVDMVWIIAVTLVIVLGIMLMLFLTVMPKFKLVQKLIDRVNLVAREILTGIPVIRAFSTEKHEEDRFDKANRDLTKTNLFVNRVMTLMMPMMMFIMNLVSILIVWIGANQIDVGAMQVGDLMAFIQYAMQIIMSFIMISMMSVMLPRAQVSAVRINEIISCKPSIVDIDNPKPFLPEHKGEVEFKNVSFKYPEASDDVLENITFTAKPGQTTAIIGSTGSGKSSLVNLIPRFFDVTKGQILVDGVDVREASQHELRERIGFVPQKGVLFSGTIESNIKYGAPDISDDEMVQAAKVAQATDFIDEKDDRYQEDISQGGSNVSGGQKQRLAIARAIAKNPEIYVFDDSFSALDFKTDVALRKALKAVTADSTIIIIAQRISTILHAEQIIVLDEGKVVGIGTHSQLLNTCEVYNQIATSQLSKEELDK